MPGLLHSIVKRLRQVAFSFREKPTTQVDDYVLEHFLLYHGLVGTSPENQRSFRDVREDIFQAIESKSSLQLGIAFKVQPLWWQDKLSAIFLEVKDKPRALATLLPVLEDTSWPNDSDPLRHSDWRVRGNAANVLASLNCTDADARLVESLSDTESNATPAFCHIAYALGKLATDRSVAALKSFIDTDEPWFRVDVAGALAASQRQDVLADISNALFSDHPLQDYTAVAISRHRQPSHLLDNTSADIQDGGCMLMIGLLQASQQTFNADVLQDIDLASTTPQIVRLAQQAPNAIRIRAASLLEDWLKEHKPGAVTDKTQFNSEQIAELLRGYLQASGGPDDLHAECNRRQAIHLLGTLKIQAALPDLLDMLNSRRQPLESVIQSLQNLGDTSAAKPLVALSKSLVDLDDRCSRQASKQPVAEENDADTKTYWQILKALGNLPTPDSMALLLQSTEDFAPDKREQALLSLISAFTIDQSAMKKQHVAEAIEKGLSDSSCGVRVAALKGASQLDCHQLINLILESFDAREISVSRQTNQTLTDLWNQGHAQVVEDALQTKLKRESDQFRRKKITDFLALRQAS